VSGDRDTAAKRAAIAQTAQAHRQNAEKAGRHISQEQAERRVAAAVIRQERRNGGG
jgi:hypothetical protein